MNSSDSRLDHDRQSRQIPYPNPDPTSTDSTRPEFNLLVAGCRGGKTSFLRLLLDTSLISSRTTKDQLTSVAKFVQGCNSHTSYIRSASIDINVDFDGNGQPQPLGLTLIDTPSFDFKDEPGTERLLIEILRLVDSRFLEGIEEDWKAQSGHRYVHLCIYFLDPDQIVPPTVPGPPAPLIPRQRASSFSQPDHEPVILEPPVATNVRPSLPQADIAAIRRLSARVNVLPVIAKADILSNDRLAAVKLAIRRDLADAGIGFGIFDVDPPLPHADENLTSSQPNISNGYVHTNGTSSNNSPPTSPTSTPLLRLPYALVSPDTYSHSDGVARRFFSRHELVHQYTPSPHSHSAQFPKGRFVRTYRWGVLDVLEPIHSDFVTLRFAIFHHMTTLQRYTREYLFQKFHGEYTHHQQPARQNISHLAQITHPARPILAIDTAAQQPAHRHPIPVQQPPPRDLFPAENRAVSASHSIRESTPTNTASKGSISRMHKQRTKKITVACNFCRSRKLKCDGGHPCGQCVKRTNSCDYMLPNKRRGNVKQKRQGEDSDSDSMLEDLSPEPSLSPEVRSNSLSRRSSNAGRHAQDVYNTPTSLPPVSSLGDRRVESPVGASAGPSSRPKTESGVGTPRVYFPDNEIPHITTLPLSETSPQTPAPMSAPTLPPLRPASDLQAAQRKRAATMPGKSIRQPTSSGPKVVACNFCRARKTKCDGSFPACSSCARRQLACAYMSPNGSAQKKARRTSTSKTMTEEIRSVSPSSSRMLPTPSSAIETRNIHDGEIRREADTDLKRPLEYPDMNNRSPKKLRMDT